MCTEWLLIFPCFTELNLDKRKISVSVIARLKLPFSHYTVGFCLLTICALHHAYTSMPTSSRRLLPPLCTWPHTSCLPLTAHRPTSISMAPSPTKLPSEAAHRPDRRALHSAIASIGNTAGCRSSLHAPPKYSFQIWIWTKLRNQIKFPNIRYKFMHSKNFTIITFHYFMIVIWSFTTSISKP
jgi:hypothetical protein